MNTNPQPITRELIAADYPDIAKSFRDEGYAQGLAAGAQNERERIAAVEAQTMPGHDALIAKLKFDGKTTGPEAAVQVLAAERASLANMQSALRGDAPKPLPHAEAPLMDEAARAAQDRTAQSLSAADIYAKRAQAAGRSN